MKTHPCTTCHFRLKYDKNPQSLLGKFWRWHIKFCPGWRGYYKSRSEEEQIELKNKYKL